ncbi:MAG: MopE-related protein [Myxococcales bacterium]|nr:MopE-related protein [Myxococcales bacterium]
MRHLENLALWGGVLAVVFSSVGQARAQQIKPRFLIIVDNSGSMQQGSLGATSCSGYATNKMGHAKCAIRNILDSVGDAEFGLMRFALDNSDCVAGCGDVYQAGGSCDGELLTEVSGDNHASRLWVDNVCAAADCAGDWRSLQQEIYATGYTPIAETLSSAYDYFSGTETPYTAPTANDSAAECRPLNVILLTDGNQQGCGGNPVTAADTLRMTTVPTPGGDLVKDIKTYVIGFGVTDPNTQINNIASAGGTTAFYAGDEETLSAALMQIIFDAQLTESCDGADNDCDTVIDEGFPLFCDLGGLRNASSQTQLSTRYTEEGAGTAPALGVPEANEWLCQNPGELCNGVDDDCDGITDENPSDSPMEICNSVDDDCDGAIDEGLSCGGCTTTEICDGLDNNCNGLTDENLTRSCGTDIGVCSAGVETCVDGMYQGCTATYGDPAETCDGLDNDCDGIVDGFTESCGASDTGACAFGQRLCTAGVWGACIGEMTASNELCDGSDNDCDGQIDETLEVELYDSRVNTACGTDVGVCSPGTNICSGGNIVCYGQDFGGALGGDEVCDGLDNDCDGLTDEGNPGGGASCGDPTTVGVGICTAGTEQCVGGALICVGEVKPGAEVCDNLDNDCDGTIDDGITRSCGADVGICTSGTQTCSAGAWGSCSGMSGGAEACDGSDNDCDGKVDEGNPDSGGVCGMTDTGECQLGSEVCVGGSLVCAGDVDPTAEVCDNKDNDCDTRTDEGVSRACGTAIGVCTVGVQLCSAGGWGTCSGFAGGPEECDGEDDDCDGLIDEGNPGGGGSCGSSDVGECGLGVEACIGGALVCTGEVRPVDELCDTLDNDCDTRTDEGLTRACGTAIGVCTLGVETCAAGAWGTCSGFAGSDEVCDNKDNDCDGTIDEGDPGGGAQCGATDRGECAFGITVCIGGSLQCPAEVTASPEVCDSLDNDCDGLTDEGLSRACGSDIGACSVGTETCSAGAWIDCNADFGGPEQCNGIDDDCDLLTDEGNPDSGGACGLTDVGECEKGTEACVGGSLVCQGEIGAAAEVCDNKDNDCNGLIDDGLMRACGTSVGVCTLGTEICSAGAWGGCDGYMGEAELCDRLDNDCDGAVDEGDPGGGASCGASDVGECAMGLTRCVNGTLACEGEVKSVPEICDTFDNDCDGTVDENSPGAGVACGIATGECAMGVTICDAGVLRCDGDTRPSDELCDTLDNDCDGLTDEGNPEGGANCGDVGECRRSVDPQNAALPLDQPCGECRFGSVICEGGELICVGTVGPENELCDGLDNDCDYPCLVDHSADPPTVNCPADPCALPSTDPGYLDCDTKVDEGVDVTDPNVGVECGDDTGKCTKGSQTCIDGALTCLGGQGPTAEICNLLDDDCDGVVDDGIPVNDPCGTDVGECQPGLLVCDAGGLVCKGGVEPIDELCDGLDNDCDGITDESLSLGDACGSDVGECAQGAWACVSGDEVCVGEVTPGLETCDCLDNDCDGEVDEGTNSELCPGGSSCVMCQCALPCSERGEFGTSCPQGKAAVDVDGSCYCVGRQCEQADCAGETIEVDGAVQCAPEQADVGSCVCKQNECTFRCNGVVCSAGLVCDPTDGKCKAQSCLLSQFACGAGEYCNPASGGCEPDPCASAGCGSDQACRDGSCFASCAFLDCGGGEVCMAGECAVDRCAASACDTGTVCDPNTSACVLPDDCFKAGCADGFVCDPLGGGCQPDPCLRTTCPQGQLCRDGDCQARCAAPTIDCNDVCIDPRVSKSFCGASGNCQGDNAGVACAEGEVCSNGSCGTDCGDGLLLCGDGCIDPLSDAQYCGASGDCSGAAAGKTCDNDERCEQGSCVARGGAGSGEQGGSSGKGVNADGEPLVHVLATGGGGCKCRVAGSPTPAGSNRLPLGLSLLLGGLVALRRRRRRKSTPSTSALGLVCLSIGVGALLPSSGCTVDPFCLNCGEDDSAGVSPGDDGKDSTGGGQQTVQPDRDAGPTTQTPDTGVAVDSGPSDGCISHELCNGSDDDCDGNIDEDADPAAEGIDLLTDVEHCGGCGNRCSLPSAFSACSEGACTIDGCDVGHHDLDGDPKNGCEYRCSATASDDLLCDLRDNDCDGSTDEDVDFKADKENCGSCSFRCGFPHAENGGTCVDGACQLDPSQCDEGFHDINGNPDDGCEYACAPADPRTELCNAKDDDCDGRVDEGVAASDPAVDVSCGSDVGTCKSGTTICNGGAVQCQGSVAPTTEVCDGKDNNCNGDTDESDPKIGQLCGNGIGECVRGNLQCEAGELVCVGAEGPFAELCNARDDDCDGLTDEKDPEGGVACGLDPSQVVGTCKQGTTLCQGGVLVCPGLVGPVDELCDGKDNDCDGVVDNGNPQGGGACGSGIGECAPGIEVCSGGKLVCEGGTVATTELCNGLDDDCNGVIDNGVESSDPAIGVSCGDSETGECAFGLTVCQSGSVQCRGAVNPVDEICDGKDNDCNGTVDDGNPGGGAACGVGRGECAFGSMTCMNGGLVCTGGTGPADEICDGKDNDCDGLVDNGVTDVKDPRIGQACGDFGSGECSFGVQVCAGGSIQCSGYQGPTDELCDGLDNDCDGTADNGNPESGGACGSTIGACSQGAFQCSGGVLVCMGDTRPATEICNGLDDNCDGLIDNGVSDATDARIGQPCGDKNSGECSFGTQVCAGGSIQCSGYNGPTDELCDGLDNDCDGLTDEGNPEGGAACGSNIGACSQGAFQCSAGTLVCTGGVTAAPEICDGIDNNCDGLTDNGVTVTTDARIGQPCGATDAGECDFGTQVCSGGSIQCSGYRGAVDELCDTLDNDCDGSVDENNPEGGAACGSGVGACTLGAMACTDGALICTGDVKASPEICDGIDNDCDGEVDNAIAVGDDPRLGQPCGGTDAGECVKGSQVCEGGSIQCNGYQGATDELCDTLDNDCDGFFDEMNPEGGAPCGSDIGACSLGIVTCSDQGVLECVGQTLPANEVCNGIDDDCDGSIDDAVDPLDDPRVGATCGATDVGACSFGTQICASGTIQCEGYIGPVLESCNGIDDDCDTTIDNGFDTTSNVLHCGACNSPCPAQSNAIVGCSDSACVILGCNAGFTDDPNVVGNDCLYECTVQGVEICNGIDDDCDGTPDNGVTAPTGVCNPNGLCTSGSAECTGAGGWQCSVQPGSELCDALDNDCDGASDEDFPTLGNTCFSSGIGACITSGTIKCDPADASAPPLCLDASNNPPAQQTEGSPETCDGIDNDCDGFTDEPCAPGVSSDSCVVDAWAQLPGGTWIYSYEASRPGASASSAGSAENRACSTANTLPWTNITYPEAVAACESAGARICTEAEWLSACEDNGGSSCTWSYNDLDMSIDCTVYDELLCNGIDSGQGQVLPGGSMADCFRTHTGVVYDLSGNVKEWTLTRGVDGNGNAINPLRGGALNNIENGISCGFEFTVASDSVFFFNIGFRCCHD